MCTVVGFVTWCLLAANRFKQETKQASSDKGNEQRRDVEAGELSVVANLVKDQPAKQPANDPNDHGAQASLLLNTDNGLRERPGNQSDEDPTENAHS